MKKPIKKQTKVPHFYKAGDWVKLRDTENERFLYCRLLCFHEEIEQLLCFIWCPDEGFHSWAEIEVEEDILISKLCRREIEMIPLDIQLSSYVFADRFLDYSAVYTNFTMYNID